MEVNFNNLRIKMIRNYNSLIKTLNDAIVTDVDMDRVVAPVNDIKRTLDNLRDGIVTLGCLFEKDNDDCKCVLTDDMIVAEFMPEKDE